ncbi:hypothetical protein MMC17_009107 [Xylographa soralifera]|nr:hypothetical protein [Xylographa soralifera]
MLFKPIFKRLPLDSVSFTRCCRFGWEFKDRYTTHLRLGDAWILVTPEKNWLFVVDVDAVSDIFARGRDFTRPTWMYASLGVFGPNISLAEGADWQRFRKLIATPFNEQNSSNVWDETLRQGHDMLDAWVSADSTPSALEYPPSTTEDSRTLALHVLTYAGFQKSVPFKVDDSTVDQVSTYRALSIILRNALLLMVVPHRLLALPFLPTSWAQIGWAVTEFKKNMTDLIEEENILISKSKPGSGTLVSNLVRASEDNPDSVGINADDKADQRLHKFKRLSKDEILGNIFVINFAGHDTTATALAYGVYLVAAHPECQDWLAEELNYFSTASDSRDWKYDEVFPRLKRCLAVMLETLRLYNPVPGIPKWTSTHSTTLRIQGQDYLIPPQTLVLPSLMALHTHPRYWGDDSLVWRPSRWIVTSAQTEHDPGSDNKTRFEQEELMVAIKGSYIPWSEGVANCPGKKFAQVEFVAAMASLFKDHRAQPVAKPHETLEQARRRVLDVVADSGVNLLLEMENPGSVSLQWTRR